MKITIRKLANSQQVLNELASVSLPANVSYKIFQNIKLIEKETDSFWKARQQRLEGFVDEQGNVAFPDDLTRIKINKELDEILDKEVDINFNEVSVKMLDNTAIPASTFYLLDYMFEE